MLYVSVTYAKLGMTMYSNGSRKATQWSRPWSTAAVRPHVALVYHLLQAAGCCWKPLAAPADRPGHEVVARGEKLPVCGSWAIKPATRKSIKSGRYHIFSGKNTTPLRLIRAGQRSSAEVEMGACAAAKGSNQVGNRSSRLFQVGGHVKSENLASVGGLEARKVPVFS